MKNAFLTVMLLLAIATSASAQGPTYTVPLTQSNTIFNAVTAATISGCLSNQGQNLWFSNYLVSGGTPNTIQYRLEYSYNSDAATCTTGTWFAMSDDATDLTQGEVIGVGSYPFIRANLVSCDGCNPATFTAFYNASSSTNAALYGFYNPSQQVRKTAFVSAAANANQTTTVACPYGSTSGFLVFNSTGTLPANSTLSLTLHYGSFSTSGIGIGPASLGYTGAFTIRIPTGSTPCTTVDVKYTSGGASTKKVSALYFFFPPGSTNPPGVQPDSPTFVNQEVTSAVNTAVSVTLTGATGTPQRGYVYSVSARCSAGTAQLTITDGGGGGTQIYSTAATQVGTSNFDKTWPVGLSSNPTPATLPSQLTVTLGTCGGANTGTLDVQGSVF